MCIYYFLTYTLMGRTTATTLTQQQQQQQQQQQHEAVWSPDDPILSQGSLTYYYNVNYILL